MLVSSFKDLLNRLLKIVPRLRYALLSNPDQQCNPYAQKVHGPQVVRA